MKKFDIGTIAVSSRIRLARNFKDFPFPGRLMKDAHAEEQASEIIRIVSAELMSLEEFEIYRMSEISSERAALLQERHLISRDLMKHRRIAAALVSKEEDVSVMINEEDHIREQYFTRGFDLKRSYERILAIDEVISESIPFAYDPRLGYLTACPTNLGTGLRASVMLFLPALSRRGFMEQVTEILQRKGLTVRGAFGEGSGAEGDMYQISNEVTLGTSEDDNLDLVEQAVYTVARWERQERLRMRAEGPVELADRISRAFGILTNCRMLGEKEFIRLVSDLKLGVALGYIGREDGAPFTTDDLDDLIVAMRPAGINRRKGETLTLKEQDIYRAEHVAWELRFIRFLG